ncbi:MAG: ATP-binding cassette domain-containing protein, partial [Clostridiales bacterium]|nr:ATP-binding cassette domain-containing protein [Clostridiales bacterium]
MSTADSVNISMEPLIEVRDLRVAFGERRRRFEAVRGVSFDIRQGETFGLVGESGSGKTSIGRAIIRVYQTSGGEIRYRGERISGRISKELDRQVTREIQMIFQDPMASLNERAKVDYIVSEGLYSVEKHLGREERQARVRKALEDVGLLPEFAS